MMLSSFVIIIVILLLGSTGTEVFPSGQLPYHNQNIAEGKLDISSTSTIITPLHWVLALLNQDQFSLSHQLGGLIQSVLLLILLNMTLQRFAVSYGIRCMSLLFFAITPQMVTSVLSVTPESISLVIALLCFLLLSSRYPLIGILPLILLGFFGIVAVIYVLLLLLIYHRLIKKRTVSVIITLFVTIATSLLVTLPNLREIISNGCKIFNYQPFITDLGTAVGISIFSLILALYGLGLGWQSKKRYYVGYISFAFLLLITVFFPTQYVFLGPAIALLSSVVFNYFSERHWAIPDIRGITLLLVILGVSFSTVAFITDYSDRGPSMDLTKAAHKLTSSDTVLTDTDLGPYITHFSGAEVYGDTQTCSADRDIVIDAAFNGRNLNNALKIMASVDITHILITPEMVSGKTWKSEDEGLLFLLGNIEHFQKVYETGGVTLYEVIYDVG